MNYLSVLTEQPPGDEDLYERDPISAIVKLGGLAVQELGHGLQVLSGLVQSVKDGIAEARGVILLLLI